MSHANYLSCVVPLAASMPASALPPLATSRPCVPGLVLSALMLCLIPLALFTGSAFAAEAQPGYKSLKVGAITVTALLDRPGGMDIELFSGPATPEQRQALMPEGKAAASITAFLIQSGDRNILVDTGFGTLVPGASQLPANLAAVGLSLEAIDTVLLTHMHTDHIGGLLVHKKRAFPKAVVLASREETDYWTGLAEQSKSNPNAGLVKKVMEVYGKDMAPPFALGSTVLPGVTSVNAAGHTPGHSAFLVESEGESLLIVGDLIHAAALQFPFPEECARYDVDPEAATVSRKAVLNMAAEKNIPIAGMHIPFAGMGRVKVEGKGFSFTPLP